MIAGRVNERHEVIVRLSVRDSAGQAREIESILDTGFTGSLTLPPSIIASLGLRWRSRTGAVLANGRTQQFDIYAATVVWDGRDRPILVQAIDNVPLLGMRLLAGHDLRARVAVGGAVEIEPIH
jgi:clan AA aspartic protease